jgi:hypothetical protein
MFALKMFWKLEIFNFSNSVPVLFLQNFLAFQNPGPGSALSMESDPNSHQQNADPKH